MARCSSPENYYSSGRNTNFADFDLYIGGETNKLRNLGFRQCKTIIMPLIPISYSSQFLCVLLSALPSLC